MSADQLFYERVAKALKKKRVPSEKERKKIAGRRGGFDTSRINKQALKDIERTHDTCYWCKAEMIAIADETHRTGSIIMTCETPECIGNYYEKESEKRRGNKRVYGRLIDQELCFDFAKLLMGRDPRRLAVTPQGLVL